MNKILITIVVILGLYSTANAQLRVLTVPQGGTGANTLTGCLEGNGTGAITGTGVACGSGGGGGGLGWASSTVPDSNSIYSTAVSNVGIGTSTPEARLHVVGPNFPVGRFDRTTTVTNNVVASNGLFARTTGVIAEGFTSMQVFGGIGSDGVESIYGGIGGMADTSATDYGRISLRPNRGGTYINVLTAAHNGSVGIGVDNPASILDIRQSTSSPLTQRIQNFAGNTSGDVAIFLGTSGTSGNNTVGAGILADRDDLSGGGGTALTFSNSIATTYAERMRIASNGNIGIGTTTPASKITTSVSGLASGIGDAVRTAPLSTANGVVGTVLSANASNVPFVQGIVHTTGATRALLLNPYGGNVGVGVDALPTGTLQVKSASESSSIVLVSGPVNGLRLGTTASLAVLEGVDTTGSGSYQQLNIGGSSVALTTSGTERMRVTSTGVGIGTTTPNDKLTVYGGGIGINPGGASRPTCTADTRGDVWNTFGGAGVADTFAVCQKDAADAYSWVTK